MDLWTIPAGAVVFGGGALIRQAFKSLRQQVADFRVGCLDALAALQQERLRSDLLTGRIDKTHADYLAQVAQVSGLTAQVSGLVAQVAALTAASGPRSRRGPSGQS